MYQVLARKWRPRSFDEVVGQGHVTRTLANAIEAERLAHAYIFAGIRGTGKTTVARILAKCLNCEQGRTTSPCNECPSCLEIAESRAMDVLELDAASRTGVDNIRELQEVIAYAPVRDRYKILIIDEAHMLSKAAFNALLKTLEEPPPNVIFVLATTEMQKILPTILSRCQVYEFRRVGVREMAAHLRRICDAEEVRISDTALERVVRAGEGSVRDALSVLERVLAFCGHEVDDDDVLRMLGGVRLEVLVELLSGLAAHDAGVMLGVLDGLLDEGHDPLHFWAELISALRDLMLLRAVPGREEMLARSPGEAKALSEASAGLSEQDLARAFQILADLETGLKNSAQPRFLFEATLIRLASLGAVRPIEEVLRSLDGGEPAPPLRTATQKKNPAERAGPPATRQASSRDNPRDNSRAGSPAAPKKTGGTAPRVGAAEALIQAISDEKPMLGVVLEDASRIELDDDTLAIRFEAGKEAMVRQIQRKESVELLQRHATRLGGGPVKIEIGADLAPPADPGPANGAEAPRPAAAPPRAAGREHRAPAPKQRPASRPERESPSTLLDRAKQDPGVQKLLREFGAQVVEIRPLAAATDPVLKQDDVDTSEESP